MPRYTVQAPDGRTVTLEGDSPPTEADLDQVFASLPPAEAAEQFSGWESAARGALEGASLGFVDEIYGGIRSLMGDDYTESRDRFRADQAASREEDPWTFGLSEVGGSFAIPGLGAGKAAAGGAAKALPRALRAAGAGAGVGGVAGLGYSEGENVGEVAGDTLQGATLGGVLGLGFERGGRVLQRARHRYSTENRAERALADMFEPEQAKRALAENKNVVLGDLTSEGRSMMASMAGSDDVLFNRLRQRIKEIPDELQAKLPSLDELAPEPNGAAREATYNFMRKPRGTLDALQAKYGSRPGFAKEYQKAVETVERKGITWKPNNAPAQRRYGMAIIDNLQSRLYKKANPSGKKGMKLTGQERESWASLRGEFLEDIRLINSGYVDEVAKFGTLAQGRRETEKVFNRVIKNLNGKGTVRYLDDVMDVNVAGRDDIVQLVGEEGFEQFIEGARVYRAMLETVELAKRQRKVSPGVLKNLDANLSRFKDDVKNIFQSAAADRWMGVQQKLGTAAAVRRFLKNTSDMLPFVRSVTGGSSTDEALVRRLASRELPSYKPAKMLPLSKAAARTIGTGAAITGG